MHYNHTQTNEPPPTLHQSISPACSALCTHSLSPKIPIENFHYTPVSFKSIGGLYSSKKNNAISHLSFRKKKARVRGKSEKGRTKVTLDDLGDQGGVGESHSLEGLGVLFFFFPQVSHLLSS